MKNRVLLVLVAIVLTLSLVAFAACKAEEAPPVEEGVWQWPDKIIVAATGTDSPAYAVGIAWTTPFAKDTGVTIRVVAEGQHSLRCLYLQEGKYLCSAERSSGQPMLESTEEYATRYGGPWQLRLFYPLGSMNQGFVVRGDSDLKTPLDIKPGMRMPSLAWMPGKPGSGFTGLLLAWAGLEPEDIIWVPAANYTAMINYVVEGKVDVSFGSITTSPPLYEAEASPHGIAWLDMNPNKEPEGAARYWAISEYLLAPMTTGVPSCHGIWGTIHLSTYSTSANTDEELVYHVVKWLTENHDKYKDMHPWCPEMNIDNLMIMAETSFIPLHRGTVRYLEEIGRWTPVHEARWQRNLALITEYVEGYQAAIDFADENGIDVDPLNQEWLDLWYSYRDKLTPLKQYTGLD